MSNAATQETNSAKSTNLPRAWPRPNLVFSHMGISVENIGRMTDFYTRVLGYTITDRGEAAGMELIFLSRDPLDHHQIVLATGRPRVMPANVANNKYGPSINQISFKMATLGDLREMYQRLRTEGVNEAYGANHGIAWSVYAPDPEGNNLEFFVDSDWYITQPFLEPLDFSQSDEEILTATRELCSRSAGFEPFDQWRARIGSHMTRYMPPNRKD